MKNSLYLLPQWISLFLFLALGAFFGMLFNTLILNGFGIELGEVNDLLSSSNTLERRKVFRFLALTHHLSTFILPSILYVYLTYRKDAVKFLHLKAAFSLKTFVFASVFFIASLPIIQLLMWINLQVPLPVWATSLEENNAQTIVNLLAVNDYKELIFNLLVIAVIPAVGEELLFKGILQQKLIKSLKNVHLAIGVGAFIFSAIHFQFEGFLARWALGAILGYLFWWTKNLWIPISLHFINNAVQVIIPFYDKESIQGMASIETDPMTLVIRSVLSIIVLILLIRFKVYYLPSNDETVAQN